MRLIGQPGRGGHLGGRHAVGEECFCAPQADGHQHLVGRNVEMGFELALKMVRAERDNVSQLVQGQRAHIVVVQIVANAFEAVRGLLHHRRMMGQWLKSLNQIQ